MSEDQAANVIKFPGKQKGTTASAVEAAPSVPEAEITLPVNPLQRTLERTRANASLGMTFLAIALATVAANRYAYEPNTLEASSESRAIASVGDHGGVERDAAWEKNLAERLALTTGDTAGHLGRAPTMAEDLRFAALEDKYVINWRADAHGRRIASITLAGAKAVPMSVDGIKMLSNYGRLFDAEFATAKLKSVNPGEAGTVEHYQLIGRDGRVRAEAAFALDADGRLLSVSTQPVQI